MAAVKVSFHPQETSVAVPQGSSILQAASGAGLNLHAPCGGEGRCGKCAVRFLSGAPEPTPAEGRFLTPEQLRAGWRLACASTVSADAELLLPPGSVMVAHRIMVEGIGREILVEPNVRKVALHLPAPSADDSRADLVRLLDALGGQAVAAMELASLRDLPALLRRSDYRVTAVLLGDEEGRRLPAQGSSGSAAQLVAVEPGDTADDCYGAAVDVGTTTVVAYLCHLPTGKLLATAADVNPQAQYGEDVISRLRVATTEPDGRERLNQAVVGVINQLIAEAGKQAGVSPRHVYEVAVVGNTCMTHLLLGVPASGLTALPFVPSFRSAQKASAAELGLSIHPVGQVYVAPNIGGFVGADTVGVILASELDQPNGLRVAVDIGTNGEIVVADDGHLIACSTAAGPAFEGARIAQGMRAATGAIDRVEVGEDVSYHVLGEGPPRGLCGSGLVDLAAGLVGVGVVSGGGRLLPPEQVTAAPARVRGRVVRSDEGVRFMLASGEESALEAAGRPVALTDRDVRELQLAKAAIFTGITMLLERLGRCPREVEELLLAGAFGSYIRRESAVAIGLLPALPLERIRPIGNAAGLGARLMLSSVSLRRQAEEFARRVEHIELSQQEGFYERFAEAMGLRPMM